MPEVLKSPQCDYKTLEMVNIIILFQKSLLSWQETLAMLKEINTGVSTESIILTQKNKERVNPKVLFQEST